LLPVGDDEGMAHFFDPIIMIRKRGAQLDQAVNAVSQSFHTGS
jgi:hypothetical protein